MLVGSMLVDVGDWVGDIGESVEDVEDSVVDVKDELVSVRGIDVVVDGDDDEKLSVAVDVTTSNHATLVFSISWDEKCDVSFQQIRATKESGSRES